MGGRTRRANLRLQRHAIVLQPWFGGGGRQLRGELGPGRHPRTRHLTFWQILPTVARRTAQSPPARPGSFGLPKGYTVPSDATRGETLAISYAISKLGDAYVWGAAGPASFDCSGLTMMAWRQAGVALAHYTGDQFARGHRRRRLSGDLPGRPGAHSWFGWDAGQSRPCRDVYRRRTRAVGDRSPTRSHRLELGQFHRWWAFGDPAPGLMSKAGPMVALRCPKRERATRVSRHCSRKAPIWSPPRCRRDRPLSVVADVSPNPRACPGSAPCPTWWERC